VVTRERIFEFVRSLFKIQKGIPLPWYLKVIYCILFPSRLWLLLLSQYSPFKYDPYSDALIIDGIQVHAKSLIGLFRSKEGTLFRVVKKENGGAMWIETIEPEEQRRQNIKNGFMGADKCPKD